MSIKSDDLENSIINLLKNNSSNGVTQDEILNNINAKPEEISRVLTKLIRRGLVKRKSIIDREKKILKYYINNGEEEIIVSLKWLEDLPCYACSQLFKCETGGFRDPSSCSILTYWLVQE